MQNLAEYSRAYGSTTRDNIKLATDAFNEQQKLNEVIKDNKFAENMEKAFEPIDRVRSVAESMSQAFSDGIKGMITGAMSFKNVMSNVIDSVINKLFEMFVVQQITGMITKGLTSIGLPGFKAIGGPVQSGKPYVVGERGPEMFVPSRSGSIVPNNKMGSGMVVNVDARGASDPAAVRQQVELGIAQAAPYIIAAAQNRTLKTAGRARLPGTIG
jgi:flagellar hook-basal body complex protein FliE